MDFTDDDNGVCFICGKRGEKEYAPFAMRPLYCSEGKVNYFFLVMLCMECGKRFLERIYGPYSDDQMENMTAALKTVVEIDDLPEYRD